MPGDLDRQSFELDSTYDEGGHDGRGQAGCALGAMQGQRAPGYGRHRWFEYTALVYLVVTNTLEGRGECTKELKS